MDSGPPRPPKLISWGTARIEGGKAHPQPPPSSVSLALGQRRRGRGRRNQLSRWPELGRSGASPATSSTWLQPSPLPPNLLTQGLLLSCDGLRTGGQQKLLTEATHCADGEQRTHCSYTRILTVPERHALRHSSRP